MRPYDPVLPDGRRVVKPFVPTPLPFPAVNRDRECVAPQPSYYVPHKPYPVQHLVPPCSDQTGPPDMNSQQPEISGEYLPQPIGAAGSDGAVISDRP